MPTDKNMMLVGVLRRPTSCPHNNVVTQHRIILATFLIYIFWEERMPFLILEKLGLFTSRILAPTVEILLLPTQEQSVGCITACPRHNFKYHYITTPIVAQCSA